MTPVTVSSPEFSALILDRDGTIVAMVPNAGGEMDSPYYSTQIQLYPGLGESLRPWVRAGVPIFLATNQPGLAKGHFTPEDLADFHTCLTSRLMALDVPIAGIFLCPHHPVGKPGGDASLVGDCPCRKPKPGLLWQIRDRHGIDLSRAVMIGDSSVDIEAARAAGVGTAKRVRTYSSGPLVENDPFPTLSEVLNAFH